MQNRCTPRFVSTIISLLHKCKLGRQYFLNLIFIRSVITKVNYHTAWWHKIPQYMTLNTIYNSVAHLPKYSMLNKGPTLHSRNLCRGLWWWLAKGRHARICKHLQGARRESLHARSLHDNQAQETEKDTESSTSCILSTRVEFLCRDLGWPEGRLRGLVENLSVCMPW